MTQWLVACYNIWFDVARIRKENWSNRSLSIYKSTSIWVHLLASIPNFFYWVFQEPTINWICFHSFIIYLLVLFPLSVATRNMFRMCDRIRPHIFLEAPCYWTVLVKTNTYIHAYVRGREGVRERERVCDLYMALKIYLRSVTLANILKCYPFCFSIKLVIMKHFRTFCFTYIYATKKYLIHD